MMVRFQRVRHWLVHLYAMAFVCDLFDSTVSDAEWDRYRRFMHSHGFGGCP